MSIVVYSNGVLAGDSRAIIDKDLFNERPCKMLKVFRFSDFVAFGWCGDNKPVYEIVTYQSELNQIIIDAEKNRKTKVDLPEWLQGQFGDTTGNLSIAITRRTVWSIREKGIHRIKPGIPITMGTGSRVALQGLRRGLSVEDSIRLAVEIIVDCGGTIISVKQSDLKAIRRLPSKNKIIMTDGQEL